MTSSDVFLSSLVNVSLNSEDNMSIINDCLLSYSDSQKMISFLKNLLKNVTDQNEKRRISQLLLHCLIQKSEQLLDSSNDDFLFATLNDILIETPCFENQHDISVFIDFLLKIFCMFRDTSVAKIFNLIIKSESKFSTLAIAVLSKNQNKLIQPSMKFIMAMLDDLQYINIYAAIYFFRDLKFDELNEDSKNEFNKVNGEFKFQNIIKILLKKKQFMILALDLINAFWNFYTIKQGTNLLESILSNLITLFKEQKQLRIRIIDCFLKMPKIDNSNMKINTKLFLTLILPLLSIKLDEVDDEYESYLFKILDKYKNTDSSILESIVFNLINNNNSLGLIFGSYLRYFEKNANLVKKAFPNSPKLNEAMVATYCIITLSNINGFNEDIFKNAFECLLFILSSSQLLDNLILQFRAFKSIECLSKISKNYPLVVSTLLFKSVLNLKGDDILSNLLPIANSIIDSNNIFSLSSSDYSNLFINLIIKIINEPNQYELIIPFLRMMSKTPSSIIIPSDILLCDLFDIIVPVKYIDSVRSEAILLAQTYPRASLIAISLPKCAPFMPTLCRIVRELFPEDIKLTHDFLINAAKRDLDQFLPHLMRFTDFIETSSNFLFVSFKEKTKIHNKSIFNCISYISKNKKLNQYQITYLLSITEAAFPESNKIDVIATDIIDSFIALAKYDNQNAWPASLLKLIFSFSCISPCFPYVLKHSLCDLDLIITIIKSYSMYISNNQSFSLEIAFDNKTNNYIISEFLLNKLPKLECLDTLLKSMMIYFESSKDLDSLLDFCLISSKIYNKLNIINEVIEGYDFVINVSKFLLSESIKYRKLVREILISLYHIENFDFTIFKKELIITDIVENAKLIFNHIFSSVNQDYIIKISIFVTNCRPFSFIHSLIIESLLLLYPELFVNEKKFVMNLIDASDTTKKETKVHSIKCNCLLAKSNMELYLNSLLSKKLSETGKEIIILFIKDQELKPIFYNVFGDVVKKIKLPQPSLHTDFLLYGYFQALPIIIKNDLLIKDIFASISIDLIIWISMVYDSTIQQKSLIITNEISNCFNELFIKVGNYEHEPIEISFLNIQSLYQSISTFSNSLLLIDYELLLNFCKQCFILLQSKTPSIVLISSMYFSRIFFKLHSYNVEKFLPYLRKSISICFKVCSDENCRILSGLLNDSFNINIASEFNEEELNEIINGIIRGISFPGNDLRNDSFSFLCKIVIVSSKEILTPLLDKLWKIFYDFDLTSLSIRAATSLVQIEHSKERLQNKFSIERLLLISFEKNSTKSQRALTLIETLFETKGIENVLENMKTKFGKPDFDLMCSTLVEKINRTNATENLIELLVLLNKFETVETNYQEKLQIFLLNIIGDHLHPLRAFASEKLKDILQNK